MANQLFVNLPVKDLQKSIAFFTHLGYKFNPQFTDETATCMIIGENIFVMLLVEARFRDFTNKPISDATKQTEVLLALDEPSREAVDEKVRKAMEAGGTLYKEPTDLGFMYQHSFADLDGHQWEIFWMDPARIPQA